MQQQKSARGAPFYALCAVFADLQLICAAA
jgi:hypothetical protein